MVICTSRSIYIYKGEIHYHKENKTNGGNRLNYGRMNARVHEKVVVLFQESFNTTTIFLQLRHFLLDVFQEVRVGPIKSKLS